MANDNFWLGVMLGHFFTKKNNNNGGEQKKFGCFSWVIIILAMAIIGLFSNIIDSLVDQHNYLEGILSALFLALLVFITVKLLKWRKNQKILAEKEIQMDDLFQNGQYTPALEIAESIAEKDALGADYAGVCYRAGLGCDKNLEKAFKYFEMAKDSNIEAAGNYGAMLIQGEGCVQDKETGLKYLEKAAVKERYAPACAEYALLLLDGTFIEKNEIEGRKYLRLASEGGIESATELLNRMTGN